jgi:hypothetical protein
MALATKGKWNVALDGQGFILQGVPDRPAYVSAQAPVYGTRFASGDRDYNDLSQWWYLIQTDWSGGIKDNVSFADDARYYYSTNIDAWSETGKIQLARAQTAVKTFTEDITVANVGFNNNANNRYFGTKVGSGGEPVLYEETAADPGVYTDIAADFLDSADTAVSHIFTNLDTVFALVVGTNSTGAVLVRQGSITDDVSSHVDSVMPSTFYSARAGCSINGVAYVFVDDEVSYGIAKTSVNLPDANDDWSLVLSNLVTSGIPIAAAGYNGNLYYLVLKANETILELRYWDIASSVDVSVQQFSNISIPEKYGLNNLLQVFQGKLIITVPSEEIWVMEGGGLSRVYTRDKTKKLIGEDVTTANLSKGCIVSEQRCWWGNLSYDGIALFNTIRPSDNSIDKFVYPLFTDVDDSRFMGEEVDPKKVYKVSPNSASYKAGADGTAFVVLNEHDKLQSIDKLLHNVNIGFDPLTANQEIEVYYMTGVTPVIALEGWTLLGEATHTADGGTVTFKNLPFPVGVNPKKAWFRVQLKGPGTSTPKLTDFTLEYLPIPDYRRQWVLNINAGDDLQRLDGSNETRTGREMAGFLENLWLKKQVFQYQDLEYAGTQLRGGINASVTTIPVDDTSDFPERGRLLIGSEEVFYTGKTPNSFTGCIRGRQGTVAAAHADNLAVYTGLFKAIITGYQRTVPILQRDKDIESVVQLSLRETGT